MVEEGKFLGGTERRRGVRRKFVGDVRDSGVQKKWHRIDGRPLCRYPGTTELSFAGETEIYMSECKTIPLGGFRL